jgi:endoglycosylceramidase
MLPHVVEKQGVTMRVRSRLMAAAGVTAAAVVVAALTSSGVSTSLAAGGTAGPVSSTGTWLTDASGRVVILHGLNQVYKVAPFEPSADGFGDDDAAFLQANGFNVVRVGVIWGAVEPEPGVYDDAYLASIKQTVTTLAAHGIMSLLDFHQDLYNEEFQGEGAPAWAVQDGGLPNPALGFPFNYFANLAEDHAWDAFWDNAKAPDGIGLQNHLANAWAHVAATFASDQSVLGYELLNEPWPGTVWEPCLVPVAGCPAFDKKLTAMYQKVSNAIRAKDHTHLIWIEPNVLFSYAYANDLGTVNTPKLGFAFHDYCPTEAELSTNLLCEPLDATAFSQAKTYPNKHKIPTMLTEFGATDDTTNLTQTVALADQQMVSWTEWAYTGNDITSSSPNGQALVLDPSQPPTGSNVVTTKLKALAEVYPQAIAGTPTKFGNTSGVFTLIYTTKKVAGGTFAAGSETDIAVPVIQYPSGYAVTVIGGHVISAANATTLRVVSNAGAKTITVTVKAA